MTEARADRWRRRSRTIPSMLVAATVAVLTAPVVVPAAVVLDVVRARRRLPTVRVYLFVVQYLVNDSVEILLAPLYWILAGFGTRLSSPGSIARHQRLQQWSADVLEARAAQLLGLRIELDDASRRALTPGPVIVISRHASLFDASLPGIVYHRVGFEVRGVIMAELLADPGFDLLYGRLGSVFIPRDDGPRALAEIGRMAGSVTPATALVIFPEGRLFRPAVRDRALTRLAETDPDRAERLRSLATVLPPRPGGVLGLLRAVPEADVVLIDHEGLDGLGRIADLRDVVPVDEPIRITARRIDRAEIPADCEQQVEWLDRLWLGLDACRRPSPVDRPKP